MRNSQRTDAVLQMLTPSSICLLSFAVQCLQVGFKKNLVRWVEGGEEGKMGQL